ncbi:MAG: MarR family winged helix-turn-helix transcriptional regulator [Eubacterium sp.]
MNEQKTATIRRFNRINDEINALYHRASTKLGFSDSELIILYLLCGYDGELTQSRIIELTGMSKQTVNSSVRRMEQNGLVVLGERTNHRRVIQFTKAGENLSRDVILPFMEREEALFSDWTPEEKETFLSLHKRYLNALRRMVETLPERRDRNHGEDLS